MRPNAYSSGFGPPLLALLLSSLAYCANEEPVTSAAGCLSPVSEQDVDHAIYYELQWDNTGLTWHNDNSFTLSTNHGYVVRVRGGELVNYSAQLVECKDGEVELCPSASTSWAPFSFATPIAWAGHPSGEDDSSALQKVFVESLISRGPTAYGSVMAAPSHYCRGHYLVGPLPAEADANSKGPSLWVKGEYRQKESDDWTSFSWRSSSAYGAFVDLALPDATPTNLHSGKVGGLLVLRRQRGQMFDDVDFRSDDEEAKTKTILSNVLRQTETLFYAQGSSATNE